MTRPRQVLPGTTYLITRRTTQGQFWLRPSAQTNRIVTYCLAVAAVLYDVEVHAATIMSNHHHQVVTDLKGQIPDFVSWFHEFVSKCMNQVHGRKENMWSSAKTSYKVLKDDDAILAAMVYCSANPVKAVLVKSSSRWPGLCTRPQDICGTEITVERPTVVFSEEGKMPPTATLRISRPAMYGHLSDEQLANMLSQKLVEREREIRRDVKAAGRRFMGTAAVLKTLPSSSPVAQVSKTSSASGFNASNAISRAAARSRERNFQSAYTDALEQFTSGKRDVKFPPGTYALVRRYGVAVEPYYSD